MSDTATQAPTHEVILTDVAATKVKSLLAQEGRDDLRLRIAVQPGGCSGLIYQLYFDDRVPDGIELQGFINDNPNAQNTCACGESFH